MIELYKNIESSIIKDKDGKYVALTDHFKGIGNVYYSLLKSIGSNIQEQPIPILELILEIDELYWDRVLSPDVAWDQIGETISRGCKSVKLW